jgi:hypothetical protein
VSAHRTHKLNESEIDLDGHKGVEIETENDTVHTFTRIFLMDRTLYQAMVTMPLQSRYLHTARFLDSFKLVARSRYSAAPIQGNRINITCCGNGLGKPKEQRLSAWPPSGRL